MGLLISRSCLVMGMIFGALVAWHPKKILDAQIAFYKHVNWKMQPISMEKEVRNTRMMGLALSAFEMCSLVILYLVF